MNILEKFLGKSSKELLVPIPLGEADLGDPDIVVANFILAMNVDDGQNIDIVIPGKPGKAQHDVIFGDFPGVAARLVLPIFEELYRIVNVVDNEKGLFGDPRAMYFVSGGRGYVSVGATATGKNPDGSRFPIAWGLDNKALNAHGINLSIEFVRQPKLTQGKVVGAAKLLTGRKPIG